MKLFLTVQSIPAMLLILTLVLGSLPPSCPHDNLTRASCIKMYFKVIYTDKLCHITEIIPEIIINTQYLFGALCIKA